jgi:hypothetical protein
VNKQANGLGDLIDQLIHEQGDYLFMVLVYLMAALVVRGIVRGRRSRKPSHRIVAVPTLALDVHPPVNTEAGSGHQEELDFHLRVERLDADKED